MTTVTAIQAAMILVLVIAAGVSIGRFEAFCLSELDQTAEFELQYLTRPAWVAVILLFIPLGGILYLYCGRAR